MRRALRCLLPSVPHHLPAVATTEVGASGTREWRMFLRGDGTDSLSFWHHLPRRVAAGAAADPRVVTYVSEIPRGARAKMEMSKETAHNPIMQDVFKKKAGKPLRFFTYGDIPFNYGFIPQTWEDPDVIDSLVKCRGDGDPIDVVQIGTSAAPTATGAVLSVRVLGALALVDEGETDWKILAEAVVPGREKDGYGSLDRVPAELKERIVDWFRNYKTTDGKPQNQFAFDAKILDADIALEAIRQCAAHYDALVKQGPQEHGYWLQ